jgi:hypothetical protein
VNEIAKVISRLEQQRSTLDRAISALREVEALKPAEAVSVVKSAAAPSQPKTRRISAAGRRRIAEAARKRWAEKRAADAAQAAKTAAKPVAADSKKSARKPATKKTAAA